VDELLLSKVRLGIVAELLASEWASFSALAQAAQTTAGNLGAHLAKLVDAGYIEEEKTFVDRRPQSRYRLTPRGRKSFIAHAREMQQLLLKTEVRS
jgi:DNA-binding MarR family transcriptional regulator